MYDAADKASFDALDSWMAELKSDIGNPKDMENIVFVVCANKVNINCQHYFMLICSVMYLCYVFLFSFAKMNLLWKQEEVILIFVILFLCSVIKSRGKWMRWTGSYGQMPMDSTTVKRLLRRVMASSKCSMYVTKYI